MMVKHSQLTPANVSWSNISCTHEMQSVFDYSSDAVWHFTCTYTHSIPGLLQIHLRASWSPEPWALLTWAPRCRFAKWTSGMNRTGWVSRSMKGLKMVMSVRLCEGSMGTLTSETVETNMGIQDTEGPDAALCLLKGTYTAEQGYSAVRVKVRSSCAKGVWTLVVYLSTEGLGPEGLFHRVQ